MAMSRGGWREARSAFVFLIVGSLVGFWALATFGLGRQHRVAGAFIDAQSMMQAHLERSFWLVADYGENTLRVLEALDAHDEPTARRLLDERLVRERSAMAAPGFDRYYADLRAWIDRYRDRW